MEPTDLNFPSASSEDRQLQSWLRQAQPALADDGFSQRVLAALPAKPSRTASRVPPRWMMCLVGAGLGLAVAIGQGVTPSRLTVARAEAEAALTNVSTAIAQVLVSFSDPALLLSVLVVAASLLFALQSRGRRFL